MNKKLLRNITLSFLSALLVYVGIMQCGVAIWLALIPSLFLVFKYNFKDVWWSALLTSVLVPTFLTWFVAIFDPWYFFYAILYIGSFYWLFFLVVSLTFHKVNYPQKVFIPPIVWLLFTFLYSLMPGRVHWWFDIGDMQPMLYPVALFSGYGITFFVILMNSLLAAYLVDKKKKLVYTAAMLVLILVASFGYSTFAQPAGNKKIKIAIIQGNFSEDWAWRTAHVDSDVLDRYRKLTADAAKEYPDIIIWPEYAIPKDLLLHKDLYEKVSSIAKEAKANLVVGTLVNAPKVDPQKNYEWDTALVFSRQGDLIGRYDSIAPFPFKNWVIAGKELPIIETDVGKFGISMCYEEFLPSIAREYAKSGAQFLISLANDSPINNENAMKSKSWHARTRASENGSYLLRAANTGLTQVINPYGKVVASLEPNKAAYLVADIFIKE